MQEELGLECSITIDGYTDFVFLNKFGGVLNDNLLNKALRRIIRDCNYEVFDKNPGKEATTLPPFSNHTLRHTFTTRMCEMGVNIKAMQSILGHADFSTTMDIYAEATKDLQSQEMHKLKESFEALNI